MRAITGPCAARYCEGEGAERLSASGRKYLLGKLASAVTTAYSIALASSASNRSSICLSASKI